MMMLETVGYRSLGIQVAQTLACAELIKSLCPETEINLKAYNFKSSFVALLAGAMRPDLFESVTIFKDYSSLRRLLDWSVPFDSAQPLFCFGLLTVADVPQLHALMQDVTLYAPQRGGPPSRN